MRPAYDTWALVLEANRRAVSSYEFPVAGVPYAELRARARTEVTEQARAFSARLGVPVRPLGRPEDHLVMTGHQPELYHAGVWVKDFLLQRLSDELSASAVDVVVDTDGFDQVGITAPCLTPVPRKCRQYLAIGSSESWYGAAPVPDAAGARQFCEAGDSLLATLSAPSVRRHFAEFCGALEGAIPAADNLAELVTFARRRYEAAAGTDYAELPVTSIVRGRAFAAFVADLALNAPRFAGAYNAELEEYRSITGTRSSAQPFPNLREEAEGLELPLWWLTSDRRRTVWAVAQTDTVDLVSDGETLVSLPLDPAAAVDVLFGSDLLIAPKALALTLFVRVFCCDLFIHGVGGGRYDRVTDGVCRRYYGVEPPGFVVASLTMYLPLGAHVVADAEVAAAKERLSRLDHNPDSLLGEVEFEDTHEQERARALAARKAELVAEIASEGADKKALGAQIRAVNAELAAILGPLKSQYAEELTALEQQRSASEVLTDRAYPFCLWSPAEVADKVR